MISKRLHPAPQTWLMAAAWLALVLVALYTRSLWPIDETRYVAVAWEMWLRGDFLVPYLNGEPYSHKPPLMFWLFQAGWWMFGVNDWWPRLVPPLFALANLFLTARLARLLWPQEEALARMAPLILLGCMLWAFFSTLTLFDMLLTFFVLLGLLGIMQAWRRGGIRGWMWLGIAIGLGVLTKGPVILLHTLPVALLAPWWAVENRPLSWTRWYAGILCAVLLGAGIGLAWAIPAAITGGPDYGNAIFWGQTAHRIVHSFAHQRPWWWYFVSLPVYLFPWVLWPPLWRGLKQLWMSRGKLTPSASVRFCVAWLAPLFIMFSLISGKQAQYLLPLLPGFALLSGHVLLITQPPVKTRDFVPIAVLFIVAGAIFTWLPYLELHYDGPEWASHISSSAGLLMVLGGVLLLRFPPHGMNRCLVTLTLSTVFFMVLVHWGIVRAAAPAAYNVKPIAEYLHALQSAGTPIAHAGKYHGQYHFLGRLRQPLEQIDHAEVLAWIERHPQGRVITYSDSWHPQGEAKPEYTHDYRGRTFASWTHAALLIDKEWIDPDN